MPPRQDEGPAGAGPPAPHKPPDAHALRPLLLTLCGALWGDPAGGAAARAKLALAQALVRRGNTPGGGLSLGAPGVCRWYTAHVDDWLKAQWGGVALEGGRPSARKLVQV